MNYDPSHRRTAPANPVVIVTAGELGRRVFELLPTVAEDLGVRIRGQYGLAEIASRGNSSDQSDEETQPKSSRYDLATSAFFGINDRSEGPPQHLWSGVVGPTDDRGRREAANLLRKICPLASGRDELRVAPETTYEVYLLVDLRDRAAVIGALRFAQAITEETTHFEMTAILLTGRSSLPEQKNAESWRLGLSEIVAAHDAQNETFGCLFHRAYLLDGVNSRRAWLDSPESLCVLAARFLLQHGFSPDRRWLRMHEQARLTEGQEFREVLGSFAIRHVTCGIECIAEEVTDVLLGDALFNNANPREDDELAEQAVKEFEQQIESLVQRDHSLADVTQIRETVMNQVGKAVTLVARQNQVSRIVRLAEKLEPAIVRLHTRVHVQERLRDRRRVTKELRAQVERVDDFGRPRNVVPEVQSCKPREYLRFPIPVHKNRLIWGLAIIIVGAVFGCCVHGGALWPLIASLAVMFVGGLTVDMAPSPWSIEQIYKTWVGRLNVSTEQVEYKRYRAGRPIPRITARELPSAGFVLGGIMLVLLGIGLTIYSLRMANPNIEPAEFISVGLLAAVSAGLALYQPMHTPGLITPQDVSDTSLEGLLAGPEPEGPKIRTVTQLPPAYFPGSFGLWRFVWLTVLASSAAWAILQWDVDLRNTPYPWPEAFSHEYAGHAVRLGVLLVGGGITLLIWPHTDTHSCGRSERPLEPELRDIPASFSVSEEVDICLLDTLEWLRALGSKHDQLAGRDNSDWSDHSGEEKTFLDVIDAQWQDKLAAACRPYLHARGGLPNDWADFIKSEIAKGPTNLHRSNLARMFTLRCVQRWLSSHLKEHDWSHLMLLLQPQATWLGRYFERELAPMWPVAATPVSLDTGAAMVDSRLQMAATAQQLSQQTPWRFRTIHWPDEGDKRGLVVLVRMVQGLPLNELMNLLPPVGE